MVIAVSGQTKKVLGDRNNSLESPAMKSTDSDTANDIHMTGEGNSENGQPDFEQFRSRFGNGVISIILNTVHQSNEDLDDLVEEALDDVNDNIYIGDRVKFKKDKESDHVYTVTSSDKKGGTRILKLKDPKGHAKPDLINQHDVKRVEKICEGDVRSLIEAATTMNGKLIVVTKALCDEYKLKDKIAAIFLPKPSNSKTKIFAQSFDNAGSASSEDDDDDKPLADTRRSLLGSAPRAAGARKSNGGATPASAKTNKKTDAKKKKDEEKAAAKQKKEKEKQEQKEAKEREKNEKLKAKEDKKKEKEKTQNGAMNKFVVSGSPGSGSKGNNGTPFLTPQKRAEKKLEAFLSKLRKEFVTGQKDAFMSSAIVAGKTLKLDMIEKIPEELIRFSVKKVYDKEKDKEMMKSMSAEEKINFREKVALERKDHKRLQIAVNNHFDETSKREDLLVCASALPLFGTLIDGGSMMADALMLTQALHSLSKFLDCKARLGAERLIELTTRGYSGYVSGMGQVLTTLIGVLQQDKDFKVLHGGQRLRHFTLDPLAVSEMCRAILLGVTNPDKAKIAEEGHSKEKKEEDTEMVDEEEENDETNNESGEVDDLERSQLEEVYCSTLLERFRAEIEFWELSSEDQVSIAVYVLQQVLDSQLYADYLHGGHTEKENELKAVIDKEKEKMSKLNIELEEIPIVPDDVDESTMSRIESRVLEKNRIRRNDLAKRITLCTEIIEKYEEDLELERTCRKNAWRQVHMGMDRHFRKYWFFGKYAPNRGLWIQDFGTTHEEKLIKAAEAAENGGESEDAEKKSDVGERVINPDTWYCIRDVPTADTLMKSLNEVGSREKQLKLGLVKLKAVMAEQQKLPDRTASPSSEDFVDSSSALKDAVRQFAGELFEKRMSSIRNAEDFETQLVSAVDVETVGSLIIELIESIPASAIRQRVVNTSSVFMLEKWSLHVKSALSYSHLFMMLDMVQSRIEWGASVNNKRCKKCGKRGSSDEKVMCAECGTCYHIFCLRPKLKEVPSAQWKCSDCADEEDEEKTTKVNGRGGQQVNYAEESEEGEEDDFFTARRRSVRKRPIVEEEYDDDTEEEVRPTRAKRGKEETNKEMEDCHRILSTVQSARLYKSLVNVPIPRPSRSSRTEVMGVKEIEEKMSSMSGSDEVMEKLKSFFELARKHFEEKNMERKIEELDELISLVDTVDEQ